MKMKAVRIRKLNESAKAKQGGEVQMKALRAIIAAVFLLSMVAIVFAAPNIPEQFTEGTPEGRVVDGTAKTSTAYGSNMTQLTITDTKKTQRWQGYYGNVSGVVTLDDANNFTLYDWSLGTVEGEIYAANATVTDWGTIHCINLSALYPGNNCAWSNSQYNQPAAGAGECLNVTEIESAYGMGSSDSDGVDETFNNTLGSITVGTTTVSNCHMVNLYANDSSQSTYYWNETTLTTNNTETIIYASIVNDDEWGYSNVTWDFQMIVGDNGGDSAATTYYFYVELA